MALCKPTLGRSLWRSTSIIAASTSSSHSSSFTPLSSEAPASFRQGQWKSRVPSGIYFFSTTSASFNQDTMQAKKFVLAQRIKGAPKPSDFKIVEETLPELQDGEILCKAEWWTVDPYMRPMTERMPIGDPMPGGQVAKVIKSRSSEFPEGTQVVGNWGWRDLTIAKVLPKEQRTINTFHEMPDMKGLPDSYALGCMGMPGNTAYYGLTNICKPKAGETLVVSAAAGAVGSLVGQIGKIYGCNVLGYAGTDDKVQWLKSLGFDHAFNYKKTELKTTLKDYATKGVDCYFDNVGAEFTFHVTRAMNPFGRIALCGAISIYNDDVSNANLVPFDYVSMIYKNITLEGFVVYRWAGEWFKGINQIRDWILADKLKIEETKYDGFEKMPQAFIELLEGKNTGKVVIKA